MDIEVGKTCTEDSGGEEGLDRVLAPPLQPVVIITIAVTNKSPIQTAGFMRISNRARPFDLHVPKRTRTATSLSAGCGSSHHCISCFH
jgi:hypothetical protein